MTYYAPRVSVLVAARDCERLIENSIRSVLAQTHRDFEIVVADDGSSDRTVEIVRGLSDPRIRLFALSAGNGTAGALNHCLKQARGVYFALLCPGDAWEPAKLEKQVAFLDLHQDVGAVFAGAATVRENGELFDLEGRLDGGAFAPADRGRHEWLRSFFLSGDAPPRSSALIRSKCCAECGPFVSGLEQARELDLWIRLCLRYEIRALPENLVRLRVGDDAAGAPDPAEKRIQGMFETHELLRHYRKIAAFDEVKKIFPSAARYDRGAETDAGFALGMAALEDASSPAARLFALEMLFEAVSNPAKSAGVRRVHGFGHADFAALAARQDVFLQDAARLLENRDRKILELDRLAAERLDLLKTLDVRSAAAGGEAHRIAQALVARVAAAESALVEARRLCSEQSKRIEELEPRLAETDFALAEERRLGVERLQQVRAQEARRAAQLAAAETALAQAQRIEAESLQKAQTLADKTAAAEAEAAEAQRREAEARERARTLDAKLLVIESSLAQEQRLAAERLERIDKLTGSLAWRILKKLGWVRSEIPVSDKGADLPAA
jgi:glycosyltransferase involved in cell wall biosynthesis